MKLKKYVGMFSIMALSVSLAACGPKESSNEASSSDKKELVIWEDKEKAEGIQDAVAQFEKEHNVSVKVIEKPYAKQIEDLRMDGPAGTGPDVLTMPGDQIGTAVTEGLIKELSIGKDVQSIYTDAAMKSQMINGKVYGLPKAVETTMLYYNKDLISEKELPKTLDEWYEYSKKVTDGKKYGFLALFDQIYYAESVMSGYGGYIFKSKGDGSYDPADIGLNQKGAIEGAAYIEKFYKEGLFPAGIIGEQGINVLESLFTEGKAAAIISGPWNLEPFKKSGINYGVAKLPELPNGKNMSAFIGVKSYNVSAYSKNAKLAEQLAVFLANKENSKKRYEVTKEVPAVKALADDPAVTKSEAAKAVAEQSKFSELTPNIPEMNEVWTPADAALQTIATGKAEPKKALDQAVETIQGQIKAKHSGK
ncbi:MULTISPECIES: extracellular solute-binding protein [Bacillus]|uniref:Maltodextrin-binding protein n=1 Tax=Bacillus glycinifermentans TaxID=1664069 RepID=A0AAJ4D4U8_9BACI|nr:MULTISPECIES: extracellular solute-binding protein [Bacillus]KKB74042.1 cyclodextrin-binding protein [Bacillus sp. TH008]MBU8786195.1 extracellular solute-binding protein [Bacillus glycinifermentans]MDU0070198.1 extracellular solute-binding protein [Bacillus sp. IG6]MED8017868.1 extracellular solute-binding protein [Bacillus glycinifermentans]NUJ16646.1 extracellular solute-binding protein [Bacillus glycinifermentans]